MSLVIMLLPLWIIFISYKNFKYQNEKLELKPGNLFTDSYWVNLEYLKPSSHSLTHTLSLLLLKWLKIGLTHVRSHQFVSDALRSSGVRSAWQQQ